MTSLLVVGSVALDSVETPFGKTDDAVGGSATFFAAAGTHLHPVQVVGVVGSDYPWDKLSGIKERGADLSGIVRAKGESFRWRGKYSFDLQNRETLETRLGVFADFDPRIPDKFRDARYVFLGNIDPSLQLKVLDQIRQPTFVACDTMNLWIGSKKDVLIEMFARVDMVMVNDAEARMLSGDWNVYRSAKWILDHGPTYVVVKQGEYGAVLVTASSTFYIPAYPLEEIFDPTGAGDAFAGGFMAFLARSDDVSPANLRRAMVFGATMGSFAVERFSIQRFDEITLSDVQKRLGSFKDMVSFDITGDWARGRG